MASGEVYVQVDASVVNGGIAPMAIVSGDPEPVDGSAVIVVWIRWRYDEETGEGGYTGIGWYENDPNNGWIDKYPSLEEWKNYLVTTRPTDLNDVLGDWDVNKKTNFLNDHNGELAAMKCTWFGNE